MKNSKKLLLSLGLLCLSQVALCGVSPLESALENPNAKQQNSLMQFAADQQEELTYAQGECMFMPLALFGAFRIGEETSGVYGHFLCFGAGHSVKTKNLIITLAAATLAGIAYKKGYFSKIKNYIVGKKTDATQDQVEVAK